LSQQGYRVLTLNRPQRLNAFRGNASRTCRRHCRGERDQSCRALLLTGAGRAFCTGQDLNDRLAKPGEQIVLAARRQHYNPLIRKLRALRFPVIAAVNGAAGAGANIALACDIVLAARSANFVQAFARIGLVPDSGGTWLLPRLVGQARARGLAFLGEPLPAEKAEAWGLIWRVVDDDALMAEAEKRAYICTSADSRTWTDQTRLDAAEETIFPPSSISNATSSARPARHRTIRRAFAPFGEAQTHDYRQALNFAKSEPRKRTMTRRNTPCSRSDLAKPQAMAAGLRENGIEQIAAWDILFPSTEGDRLRQAGNQISVRLASSPADAVRGTDVIISAVTAASSLEAAQSVAPHLNANPFYLDVNSVSPGRKQATAKLLGDRARYVDVAILSPIYPARHQSPMLLAGPHVEAAGPILQALAMKTSIAGPQTGAAAAIKMVRGVMIKGIEALTIGLAAERGHRREVRTDAQQLPQPRVGQVIAYNSERSESRRAASGEMEEVAETLRELGVDPQMVTATVNRQREMEPRQTPAGRSTLKDSHTAMLDAISAAAKDKL
jgi:2-(1,2-epoxy-1,2-dihydrophenyl)acetyl-CoA isomerase